jgi:glycosyltransferase involved in cell wall biosynthesis
MSRIAAQIGVKDEVELIAPCIAHLRRIGVGRIYVQDMGSSDGTETWLAEHAGPDLIVIRSEVTWTDEELAAAVQEGIVRSHRDWEADWLIMIDADEFVLPAGGAIASVLSGVTAPLAMIPRYNVALGPGGLTMPVLPTPADYEDILFYARADKWYRKKLEVDPTLAWLRFVPLPKAAVRPGALGGLVHGMHDALDPDGQPLERVTVTDALIAHVPLSDYGRFTRKVDNIAETFRQYGDNQPEKFAWHWKRWVASAEAGTLEDEYAASCLDVAQIAALREEGVLKTAAELLDASGSGT